MRALRVLILVPVLLVVNINGYTTRSYDLEVPGSRPIRIIEAEQPDWNREHRTAYPVQDEPTTENPAGLRRRDSDYDDSSAYKLKDFLESYAENLRRRRPYKEDVVEDELYLKDVNLQDEEEDEEEKDEKKKKEKSKSWNMLQVEKHNHPYDDDKGWVSMEAVPWSMSKISKWHTKPKPDKFSSDRYHQYQKPSYSKLPYRPTKPTPSYYNEDDEEDEEIDYPHYIPNKKRPQYQRPTATYGQKVHVQTVPSSHKPWISNTNHHHHNQDCKHHHHQPEIITDGLPPDFPDHNFDYANRRRGTSENLPNTHPFKGDGEWVLLTTTKGYKHPKDPRQRSLQLPPDTENTNTIDTHKSVRLTVLPPLKDGKVNMTTSHGGLLQVESTFQTVEESQKAFAKKQKLKTKRKPIKIIRPNPTSATYQQLQNYQNYQLDNRDGADAAGVMAAVGAGMIPASMALLVPMAMNARKRRDLKKRHPTRSPYVDNVELTLPRSF